MTTCNQAALAMGKPYPEDCPTCQQGPCKYPRFESPEAQPAVDDVLPYMYLGKEADTFT